MIGIVLHAFIVFLKNASSESILCKKETIDDMSDATPRVNARQLEQFGGRTVRVLAKVVQLGGDRATVDAGGQITVLLNRVSGTPHGIDRLYS